jgi:isoquinoline 1-oxidoreductase subunit beta
MSNQIKTSRRSFLKVSGITGGGLMLGFNLYGSSTQPVFSSLEINAFILINPDGTAIIKAKNPDIGQGVKTSLPMILAEELDLPWEKVTVEQAKLDSRFGDQFTGGSTGVKTNYDNLRKAGAAVREVLVRTAADQWNVKPEDCKTEEGFVISNTNRLHYGQLAEAASKLELNENPPLKNPRDFEIIGTSKSDVDLQKIVTGQPLYGLDQEIEGMLYATVLKPEVFGSKLIDFDDNEARKVPGIIDIFKIEGMDNPYQRVEGIAVVASSTWNAFKAKKIIMAKWKAPKGHIMSGSQFKNELETGIKKAEVLRDDGDVNAAFENSKNVIEAAYHVPFVSHSQMEPMNFIADVKENSAVLIGPTQTPGGARYYASRITGIARENIEVKFSRIGGGFGRRLANDYANEAVFISHKIKKPIKLVWDRENDFLGDYYRPAGCYHFKGALDGQRLNALEVKICTTSRYLFAKDTDPAHVTEAFPDQQPAGMIPNFKLAYSPLLTNIPVGALRTPGMNATTFAYQSFIDELAEKAKADPIDFQMKMIGDEDKDMPYSDHGGPTYNTKRLRNVIELVREKSDWGANGKSQGFAGQMVFGTYVACVVDVSYSNGKIKVDKVNIAVDCGRVINPIGANAQIQGGITDGISAAFYESLELQNGKPIGQNFDQYQKLRMKDSPPVDVHFISSDEAPQGLGEPSYPILFPALANAVYKSTGKRIRELPLKKHGLV